VIPALHNSSLNPEAKPFRPRSLTRSECSYTCQLEEKCKDVIRIGTINARSWYPKADVVDDFMLGSYADVLCITETWLQSHISDNLLNPSRQCHIVRRDRQASASVRGGGVALLINKALEFQHRPDLEPRNREIEVCCIQLKGLTDPTFIFCCYRPPHQDYTMFHAALKNSLDQVSGTNTTIILTGDFNARNSNWLKSDPLSQAGTALQQVLDEFGLTQCITNHPTRFSPAGSSSSLIDLIITNYPHKMRTWTVCPPISDHSPVLADFAMKTGRKQHLMESNPISIPLFHRTEWRSVNSQLASLDLIKAVTDGNSINGSWSDWNTLVEGTVRQFVPVVARKQFLGNKPWFHSTHHHLRRRCNRLYHAAKRCKTPEAWGAYKIARSAYHSSLKSSRNAFYRRMAESLQNGRGTYQWWRKAKSLCNIGCKRFTIPDLQDHTTTATDDLSKANLFCAQFSTFSQATGSSTQSADDTTSTSTVEQKFTIQPLHKEQVRRALQALSVHKVTDGFLTNRVLREIAPAIAASLTVLFNMSISSGTVPIAWKVSSLVFAAIDPQWIS